MVDKKKARSHLAKLKYTPKKNPKYSPSQLPKGFAEAKQKLTTKKTTGPILGKVTHVSPKRSGVGNKKASSGNKNIPFLNRLNQKPMTVSEKKAFDKKMHDLMKQNMKNKATYDKKYVDTLFIKPNKDTYTQGMLKTTLKNKKSIKELKSKHKKELAAKKKKEEQMQKLMNEELNKAFANLFGSSNSNNSSSGSGAAKKPRNKNNYTAGPNSNSNSNKSSSGSFKSAGSGNSYKSAKSTTNNKPPAKKTTKKIANKTTKKVKKTKKKQPPKIPVGIIPMRGPQKKKSP